MRKRFQKPDLSKLEGQNEGRRLFLGEDSSEVNAKFVLTLREEPHSSPVYDISVFETQRNKETKRQRNKEAKKPSQQNGCCCTAFLETRGARGVRGEASFNSSPLLSLQSAERVAVWSRFQTKLGLDQFFWARGHPPKSRRELAWERGEVVL